MWGTSFYLTQTHTGGTSVLNADQIRGDFTHNTILLEVLEFVSSWWHSLHFELTLISFCEQWNVWISVAFRPAICTISNSRAVTCRVPAYYRERETWRRFKWFTAGIYWRKREVQALTQHCGSSLFTLFSSLLSSTDDPVPALYIEWITGRIRFAKKRIIQ